MNTCDTCLWWRKNHAYDLQGNSMWLSKFGECHINFPFLETTETAFFNTSADDETIMTGPRFGCVNWAAKT